MESLYSEDLELQELYIVGYERHTALVRDGGMGRWGDGEMERWGDEGM